MNQHSESSPSPAPEPRPLAARLLALVVRPVSPPVWLGIVVAAAFICAETLLVHQLQRIAPENAFGVLFLVGVLVVSAGWGFRLAVATTIASAAVYVQFHMDTGTGFLPTHPQDALAILIFIPVALLANVLAGQARLRAAEAEERRREAEASQAKASALADSQAALRRVATLVARGVDPAQVYPAAVAELSHGLGVDNVALIRYDSGKAVVLLAGRDDSGLTKMSMGERIPLEGDNVAALIFETGEPARMDTYDGATGATADRVRRLGLRSAVGAPIIVDGTTWGAVVIGSAQTEPLPPETEARICDFADLVATAISNAETRAELTASRARIVAASDQARRRFERDLHDGAQQRLVSLGLQLRAAEVSVPDEHPELRAQLSNVVDGLVGVSTELQEISRGIHPAILSKGGLGPAIKTLARRSDVPVDLDLNVDRRLSESVEVAAYYVVAEALTNAAKHAQATEVTVSATADDDELRLQIRDDGVGGAAAGARDLSPETLSPPDSRLARAAEAACAEQPPSLIGHGYRTWMFGSGLAAVDGISMDTELFYVSCLLHDYGIVEVVPGEDFTLRSARRVQRCAEDAGLAAGSIDAAADAITVHASPGIAVERDGALGVYVQAGAMFDLAGLRIADLSRGYCDHAIGKHPRDGVSADIVAMIKAEAAANPGGRFALLNRCGMPLMVRLNPLRPR